MKAMTSRRYGAPAVLRLEEVVKPVPKEGEVLIRIHATAANSGDVRLRKADPWAVRLFFGLVKPRIKVLGGVFSGVVEATGPGVTRYKKGDEVFGSAGMSFGAYAEYKCLPENGIFSTKPGNITHRQASTVPFGGLTALHFIRKARIKPGQKVLVYGASGAVGSAAVQLAKYYGAEVTGVCSTANMEMVRMLGADKVIDYTHEDFTQNGDHYDVVYEAVNKIPFSKCISVVTEHGTLILGAASFGGILRGACAAMTGSRKILSGMISETNEGISFLKELIGEGRYKAVVDKSYPLEQMAEAHAYVERGHKRGNVSIVVVGDEN